LDHLKEKPCGEKNTHVNISKVNTLSELMSKCKDVIFAVDIMFVYKFPYLVCISHGISVHDCGDGDPIDLPERGIQGCGYTNQQPI